MAEMNVAEALNVLRQEGQRYLRLSEAMRKATDIERDIGAFNEKKVVAERAMQQAEEDRLKVVLARDKAEKELVEAKARVDDEFKAHHATAKDGLAKAQETLNKQMDDQKAIMQKSYDDHQQAVKERSDALQKLDATILARKADLNAINGELDAANERLSKFVRK